MEIARLRACEVSLLYILLYLHLRWSFSFADVKRESLLRLLDTTLREHAQFLPNL
jgi:hypothetical protein